MSSGDDPAASVPDIPQQQPTEKPDSVREFLAQPPLTPEQREQKRRELLERQRAVRSKTLPIPSEPAAASTTATAAAGNDVPLREDMIGQAVGFLNSPSVKSADMTKKLAFLRSKGLNQKEIDTALRRAGDGDSATQTSSFSAPAVASGPPPVPPRPTAPQPQFGVAQQILVYQQPPTVPLSRVLAMAVLASVSVTGMTVGLLALIKALVEPIVTAFSAHRAHLYRHQTGLLRTLTEKLALLNSTAPSDDHPLLLTNRRPLLADTLAEKTLESRAAISEVLTSLRSYAPAAPTNTTVTENGDLAAIVPPPSTPSADLKSSLATLLAYCSHHVYGYTYSLLNKDSSLTPPGLPTSASSSTYGADPADLKDVQDLKTEIRGLKGVLLNRRNFPMVGTPPAASGAAPVWSNATTVVPPITSPKFGVPSIPVYYKGSGSRSISGSGTAWNPLPRPPSPYRDTSSRPVSPAASDYLTAGGEEAGGDESASEGVKDAGEGPKESG